MGKKYEKPKMYCVMSISKIQLFKSDYCCFPKVSNHNNNLLLYVNLIVNVILGPKMLDLSNFNKNLPNYETFRNLITFNCIDFLQTQQFGLSVQFFRINIVWFLC